jgi:hypothetical protein
MRYPKRYLSKVCKTCAKIFDRKTPVTYKQWETTEFCSRSCKTKWQFDQFHRDRHPRWKGGEIKKICQSCSADFLVGLPRATKAKFCSPICKIRAQDRGISSANEKVRKSNNYKEWRKGVFQRDDYTCGKHGGRLYADHIQPFAVFPELRFDLANGRTLCVPCHKLTPTYGKSVVYVKGF